MMAPIESVLADLLVHASEEGPDRLVRTDRQLRDAFGGDVVQRAHRSWTRRLREGLTGRAVTDSERGEVFDLLERLRPTVPGGR